MYSFKITSQTLLQEVEWLLLISKNIIYFHFRVLGDPCKIICSDFPLLTYRDGTGGIQLKKFHDGKPKALIKFYIACFRNSLISKIFDDILTLLIKHPVCIFLLNSKYQETNVEILLPQKKSNISNSISNFRNNPKGRGGRVGCGEEGGRGQEMQKQSHYRFGFNTSL